jgi:hypothetical protein
MEEIKSCLKNIAAGKATFEDASKLCNFEGDEPMLLLDKAFQAELASKALVILQEKELQTASPKEPSKEKKPPHKIGSFSSAEKTNSHLNLSNLGGNVVGSSFTPKKNENEKGKEVTGKGGRGIQL